MPNITDQNVTIRPADDRGTTDLGWLHSRHSFSFGRYIDRTNMGFRGLRVINDDIVAPRGGFGEHGHDNMEIITWVLDGSLKHGDSLGNLREQRHGEVQVMSAGTGIRHSEFNASDTRPVHLLQVWIEPAQRNVEPRYLQQAFDADGRHNRWQTLASGRGDAGALPIAQDAALSVAELDADASLQVALEAERHGYLHVARGQVRVGDTTLDAGDAITLAGPATLTIEATQPSELLFFDLN